MKKTHKKTPLKASDFLGTFQPKLKRIRTEPRQKMRQLLRSFPPISLSKSRDQFDEQFSTEVK